MSRSRFVRPETDVLTLDDGAVLTVKRRLNAGEQREYFTRMYHASLDGSLRVNPLQTGLALIVSYLVDWTLTDDDGQIVPIRGLSVPDLEAVINALDPDSFAEIKRAIEAHVSAQTATRTQEKKRPDGSSSDDSTSRSPSAAAGALSGSVN